VIKTTWLCCQLGAREHYAVPRALARRSALDRIITDAWVPRTSLLRIVGDRRSEIGGQPPAQRGLPSGLEDQRAGSGPGGQPEVSLRPGGAYAPVGGQRSAIRGQGFATANPSIGGSGIAERFDSELRDSRVTAFNWSLVAFEILARARRLRGWDKIIARNNWFQRKAVSALRDKETTRQQDNKGVVSLRPGEAYPPAWKTTGLEAAPMGGQSSSSPLTLFAYSYAARQIFRFAKQRGWKTVLGQIDPGPVEEKIVAEEAARVPELAGDWQPAPPEYWDNWQEECSLADHIIVNSEWSRACLVEAGIGSSKLIVTPLAYELPEVSGQKSEVRGQRPGPGVRGPATAGKLRSEDREQPTENSELVTDNRSPITRAYPARFTPDRPLRVLFLGQVNLRKGVARLFDAIRQLKNEPIEFEFVGRVQVAVPADLKNNARVRWCDAVPRGKTDDFYRNADVLIFPTLSDGFGLTQLEAQAHGLPVIASRCCGEVVKHGVNGLLLDVPVADAIVEAFRSCLADPSRLAAFSAVSRIEDRFSLDSLAQNLLSLTNTR
jgi:glycosyltransferase involved in cell wall biosynthesis